MTINNNQRNSKETKLIYKLLILVLIGAFIAGIGIANRNVNIQNEYEQKLSIMEEKFITNMMTKDGIINQLNGEIDGLSEIVDGIPELITQHVEAEIESRTPQIIEEYNKQLAEAEAANSKAVKASRGGAVNNDASINYSSSERVKIEYTYYYAADNALQGGFNDKIGTPLKSHNYPIIALPSYVKYGSELILDESIPYTLAGNYSNRYISVDTGGAIVDKGYDDNGNRVLRCDVFVPDAYSLSSITSTLSNGTVYGTLYYKN